MKILVTADLHAPADEGPCRRLAAFAAENGCGLVAVAGDLLDIFSKEAPATQAAAAAAQLRALAGKVSYVAVCSGNHDLDGPNGTGWLARVAAGVKAGNLLVDGTSAVLPADGRDAGLIVSVCPYWNMAERGVTHHLWLKDQAEKVWREGCRLADLHPGLPWVVLHHEPPEGTKIMAGAWRVGEDFGAGAFWAAEWCRRYRPGYLLCGHIHQAPFVAGGAWAGRVRGSPTWAINAGRDRAGSRHVLLDTRGGLARWLDAAGVEQDRARLSPDGSGPQPSDGPGLEPGEDADAEEEVLSWRPCPHRP